MPNSGLTQAGHNKDAIAQTKNESFKCSNETAKSYKNITLGYLVFIPIGCAMVPVCWLAGWQAGAVGRQAYNGYGEIDHFIDNSSIVFIQMEHQGHLVF